RGPQLEGQRYVLADVARRALRLMLIPESADGTASLGRFRRMLGCCLHFAPHSGAQRQRFVETGVVAAAVQSRRHGKECLADFELRLGGLSPKNGRHRQPHKARKDQWKSPLQNSSKFAGTLS